MKYIGGFFELEIPRGRGPWHETAMELSTARSCLRVILETVKPKWIHVPFFMCDSVIETIKLAGAEPVFYALDGRLLPERALPRSKDALVIAVNYFGLQSAFTREVAGRLGAECIVDNTQAFFERGTPDHWALCSARKFFGVPDGAYLYSPMPLQVRRASSYRPNPAHLFNRLAGKQQTAYRQCRTYESRITNDIRRMSELSHRLLDAIDYEQVKNRRRENFALLHRSLADFNMFDAHLPDDAVPYCYPLLLRRPIDRAVMAVHNLYVPTLWQDVIDRSPSGFEFEQDFARRLLPLPLDQRYGPEDMDDLLRRLHRSVQLDSVS